MRWLLLVFYLFFFILNEVALIAVFTFFFVLFVILVLVVIIIFRDDIQVDGMYLGDFEFGFALGATKDFALLYFVFVDVNFCGTLRAANHGSILRRIGGAVRGQDCWAKIAGTHVERIIYRVYEVNCRGQNCCDKANVRLVGTERDIWRGNIRNGRWWGLEAW
jgi:hypothetical protein